MGRDPIIVYLATLSLRAPPKPASFRHAQRHTLVSYRRRHSLSLTITACSCTIKLLLIYYTAHELPNINKPRGFNITFINLENPAERAAGLLTQHISIHVQRTSHTMHACKTAFLCSLFFGPRRPLPSHLDLRSMRFLLYRALPRLVSRARIYPVRLAAAMCSSEGEEESCT